MSGSAILLLAAAVAGLLVGSFLNVVIARVPVGESVVRPRSHCPTCGHAIRPRDNIPVLSWLILRGRCRDCGVKIPARYPAVELLTSGAWTAVVWWATTPGGLWGLAPLLLTLASAGIALTAIDLEHHRLPDAIVLGLYPVTAAGLICAGLIDRRWAWATGVIGAVIWLAVIGGLHVLTRGRGMGLGDVKFAPILGVTLGWVSVGSATVGLLASFVGGALVGGALLLLGRVPRRSRVPFGPFMVLGAGIGIGWGPDLTAAYVGLSGLG